MARQAQRQDLQRRQLDTLPELEAHTMREVFQRFDRDNSDSLEGLEIVEALRELGLHGKTTEEKRGITRIWQDAANEAADEAKKVTGAHSKRSSGFMVPREEKQSVDFLTFALKVVPSVRQLLAQSHAAETIKHFFMADQDGKGRISLQQCLEVARTMGLDHRFMEQKFLARFLPGDTCTCEDFQGMVTRCREHLQRVVKKRERDLQEQMHIDERTFQECRQDIVNLYDIFVRYTESEDGKLPRDRVMPVLREFGLQPKSFQEREALNSILKSLEEDEEVGAFSFVDFLELAQALRTYHQEQNRADQLARFERYDRNRNGQLSVAEISSLLVDVGCAPMRRKEQEELAQLIQFVDADGNGTIDFQEFQVLSQRIDEKLRSMRYEDEIEHAMTVGFSESQLRDLRSVFDSLDADGSEKLSAAEVRIGLAQMDKKVSQHAFESAFAALDQDKSGELDFLEFLDFMQLMRDGEGIFSEDSQKLASRPKLLEASLLRRVLENVRLSKSYLNSLSKDELVDTFCNVFELDSSANLCLELSISSVGDLFKLAKKRGAQATLD